MFTGRLCGGLPDMSTPSSLIEPESSFSKPAISRSVEVLPQPEGPEQGEELAARHLQVDAVHGHDVAVALDELLQLDLALAHHLAPPAAKVSSPASWPRDNRLNANHASVSASSEKTSMIVASAFSAGVGAARALA